MTAITIADSAQITGLVQIAGTNTNNRKVKLVYVEDSAATATETYDLTEEDASITGIIGAVAESSGTVTGVITTASDWSTTTITIRTTGAYKGIWACY